MKGASGSLFPICLLSFLIFGSIAMLFPVAPPFAASLGADVSQVGLVVAAQLYVAAILVAPLGMLSDRTGRKPLLLAGIGLNLASLPLYLFSAGLEMLVVARVVAGLASGALYPTCSGTVVDMVPAEKRGTALGWLTTSSQLGSMLGPAAGGFILKNYGYPAVFWTAMAVSALALAVCLTGIKAIRPPPTPPGQKKPSLGWLADRREVAALLSITFVMFGLASVNSFLPLYGAEIGIGIDRVGLIVATLYLGSVMTRALGGALSDRLGRAPVIVAGLSLMAAGVFLVSRFASETPLHFAGFVMGLGMGIALPPCGALIADIAPASMRGLAMGTYAVAFHAGQAIGATSLGMVAASAGFRNMYVVTAAAIAAALAAVFVLTRRADSQ
ncbi:MAG: MFS transporter [Chloroflexi bacterium]|nr:MFS transporter [Chloroflexota bacterium]